MRRIFLCLTLVFGAASVTNVYSREWTDASGKYKFEAELIGIGHDSVRLRLKENNTDYDIPVKLLSKGDRNYVKKRAGARGKLRKSPVTSVPSSVVRSIRENAKRKWPGNYEMQKYEIDNQREAYIAVANHSDPSVSSDTLTEIMRNAKAKWADNYEMQKYEIDNQIKGYKAVKNYRATGVPPNVLSRIIHNAVRKWSGNYEMQEYEINNQVKAYKALSRE